MDWLQNLVGNSIITALGWTLVHSIWQICIWAMIAIAILVLTLKKKAKLRYRLLAIVLLGICITSAVTFKNNYHKPDKGFEKSITTVESSQTDVTDSDFEQELPAKTKKAYNTYITGFIDYFDRHLPGIVTIWFLGFLFFFFRYVGSIAWLLRVRQTAETITSDFEEVLYRYCRKMKLRRLVEIGKSIRINTPVVIGHFKPIILFPARFLSGLSNEEIESILLHELAHVKRNDYLVNLVQSFIEIIFFYHPAIWWLSASISTEREHVCDDLAIKGGVDANQMAETLARIAGVFSRAPQYSQAFSGNQNKLKNRIHRLIFNEKMKTNLNQKVIVGLVIIIAAVVLSFTVQGPDQESNQSPEGESIEIVEASIEEAEAETAGYDPSPSREFGQSEILPEVYENNISPVEEPEGEPAEEVLPEVPEEYTQREEHDDDDDDDEDEEGAVLKTLMKEGAKAWNAYRENHPGENFEDALKESNLRGFDFRNFNLSYMNLKEANLASCDFTNADMTAINIKEANLEGAVLENANLTKADMKEICLSDISLKGAILRGANMKEITLNDCDLSNTDLSGAVMHEASIKDCKFKGAIADHTTTFPPGFDWAAEGIELK